MISTSAGACSLICRQNCVFWAKRRGESLEGAAGYIIKDLILKLTDMGLDSCRLTFTDSAQIKDAFGLTSTLDVAAIAAFGYGMKPPKRLRVNVRRMSHVDINAQRQYVAPKHENCMTWSL